MRKHQLTEAVVAQGVQAVLAEAEGAQRAATVSALAQHLGVSFYKRSTGTSVSRRRRC